MPGSETWLLGREGEFAALIENAVDAARARDGKLTVVEASPGLGRTTMLGATRARAEAMGLTVLSARAGEMERDLTWGVVRQLLGSAASAIARGSAADNGKPREFVALEQLHAATVRLAASRPLLLCVDDAHYSDIPSLRFIEYLTRRLDGLPLALVVTAAVGEPRPSEPVLDKLRFDPRAVRLRLRPLDEETVAGLVRERFAGVDDAFCTECHRSCGGNPLYLRELVDALALERNPSIAPSPASVSAAAPRTIATHVLARLQQIDRDAPRLVCAMASLDDDASLQHAGTLAGIEASRATALAGTFVREDILTSDDPVRFAQPIVARALRRVLTPGEADAMRRAAAQLLAQAGASPQHVAAQLVDTSPGAREWVAHALREGAQAAIGSGTPQTAVRFLRRALVEPPPTAERGVVLGELAFAEHRAGCSTAVERYREALSVASDADDRAKLTLGLARSLMSHSRLAEAAELLEASLPDHGTLTALQSQQVEAALISASMMDPDGFTRLLPRLERLAVLPLDSPVGRSARAALALGGAFTNASRDRILELAHQALAGSELAPESLGTDLTAIHASVLAEDFATARPLLAKAVARGRAEGNVLQWGWALEHLAELALRVGALSEADDVSGQLVDLLRRWDDTLARASGYAARIEILLELGDIEAAQEILIRAEAIRDGPLEDWSGFGGFRLLLAARGRLRLAQHHPQQAADDLMACVRKAQNAGLEAPLGYGCGSDAALALRLAGREREAAALARHELDRALAFGGERALGIALRATALADTDGDRLEMLRQSVSVLESSPARLEHARALVELGAELRRVNRRAEALEVLGFCRELASRLGAKAVERRAHAELNAAGARPRRIVRSGVAALTACELRIADLAAQGRTNAEIARILNITPKTVECHLGRAYAKLGIGGRRARTRLPAPLADGSAQPYP